MTKKPGYGHPGGRPVSDNPAGGLRVATEDAYGKFRWPVALAIVLAAIAAFVFSTVTFAAWSSEVRAPLPEISVGQLTMDSSTVTDWRLGDPNGTPATTIGHGQTVVATVTTTARGAGDNLAPELQVTAPLVDTEDFAVDVVTTVDGTPYSSGRALDVTGDGANITSVISVTYIGTARHVLPASELTHTATHGGWTATSTGSLSGLTGKMLDPVPSGSLSDTTITWSWDPVPGAIGYTYFITDAEGNHGAPVTTTSTNVTTTGVLFGHAYKFSVRATSATGASGAGTATVAAPDGPVMEIAFDRSAPGCTASPTLHTVGATPGASIQWGTNPIVPLASTNTSPDISGTYTAKIRGNITSFGGTWQNPDSQACITAVTRWDDNDVRDLSYAFQHATNLTYVATPPSTVTNMSHMFSYAHSFNQDISSWDVSQVTNMSSMFEGPFYDSVSKFNNGGKPLTWGQKTSNVTNMSHMFYSATAFNQDISSWNVSKVHDFSFMFNYAESFNNGGRALSWTKVGTDASKPVSMQDMFAITGSFNADISSWDVSRVSNMGTMFYDAPKFNQPLESWNVSNVTNMSSMFSYASVFNQPIGSWNTSKVTHIAGMFSGASAFNQPIGSWDVSNVKDIDSMFSYAREFNQPIGSWDVSNVEDMSRMFYNASAFNQPIGSWDVSNVKDMPYMFNGASTFNQDLSCWNVQKVTAYGSFATNTSLSWSTSWKPRWGTTGACFAATFTTTGASQTAYIYLGGVSAGTTINWGDGTPAVTVPTGGVTATAQTHTFATPGTYQMTLKGGFTNIGSSSQTSTQMQALRAVTRWPDAIGTTDASYAFQHAANLTSVVPPPGTITNMAYMFYYAQAFNQNVSSWNVSNVRDFGRMFNYASSFDNGGEPLKWTLMGIERGQNVIMNDVFAATPFNQDISSWNTAAVTNMDGMFWTNTKFNRPIGQWNVSRVTSMQQMFDGASAFNQNIGSWTVSNVKNMDYMFRRASKFNQNLSCWNVKNVTSRFLFDDGATAWNANWKPRWGTTGACGASGPLQQEVEQGALDSAPVEAEVEVPEPSGTEDGSPPVEGETASTDTEQDSNEPASERQDADDTTINTPSEEPLDTPDDATPDAEPGVTEFDANDAPLEDFPVGSLGVIVPAGLIGGMKFKNVRLRRRHKSAENKRERGRLFA